MNTAPEQAEAEAQMEQTEAVSEGPSISTLFAWMGHLFILLTVICGALWFRQYKSQSSVGRTELHEDEQQ